MAQRFKAKTLLSNSGVFNNQVLAPNLIYNTGDQTISGSKTFSTGINIVQSTFPQSLRVFNKTGTNTGEFGLFGWQNNQLVIGSQQSQSGSLRDLTLTGRNININASGSLNIFDPVNISGNLNVSGTGIFDAINLNNIDNLSLSGVDITITSGNVTLTNSVIAPNLIYNTGDQTISGVKTFAETGSFNTLQITNNKLSSYSLNSTNFIFGDNYLNFVNSSNNVTGTLPSGIISGINYYVKNLNSGILLITGSGQRTIDGFSTVNLYKNESLQLVGVNNPGYTGWVTISADNGVS